MREILFRGKRKDNGEWVEGSLSTEYLKECGCVMISPTADTCFKVDPETVGQYTGLTDKNGKKIFEGDIVTTPYYGIEFQTVEWVKTSCGFEPFSDSNLNCGHCGGGVVPNFCEVVGNIHDNSELLKGGAE